MPQLISIFDVDRTLTRHPTYSLFLLFAARRRAPWRLLLIPALIPHLLKYRLKRTTRKQLKETMHALLLGRRIPRSEAEELAGAFATRLASRGVYARGRSLIETERAEGRRVILATAAPQFYVAPFAQKLGVDEAVATRGLWLDDELTHQIDGENCYGPSKLTMLMRYLESEGIARDEVRVRFYSDHVSDLPTFEWADEPIAVNPSPRLRSLARERGWPILDWGL